MTTFWYEIEAENERMARYVRHILESHGLLYPWEVKKTSNCSTETIRFAIGIYYDKLPKSRVPAQSRPLKRPIAETILTTDRVLLESLSLNVEVNQTKRNDRWGYILPSMTSEEIPPLSIPFPVTHACGLNVLGTDWEENCFLFGLTEDFNTVSAKRFKNQVRQTVFCINLLEFLDRAMLGPREGPYKEYIFEDWGEAYGQESYQSLASTCSVDKILLLIVDMVVQSCLEALPAKIHYYPPRRSAPLIVTGDSDDATVSQIKDYLATLESYGVKASLLMKQFENYNEELLKVAFNHGHCFGIHPYSHEGTEDDYANNFFSLVQRHREIFQAPVFGVRNHRFQWIRRSNSIELEKHANVIFDLNCVAASGHTWLGTGSGVGFPIAFPPRDSEFSVYPLHLPTVLEDDVLLYSQDYCYKTFESGVHLPVDAALSFLQNWIFLENRPATVNLHPEHVIPTTRSLLDSILKWAHAAEVWMPTLKELATWVENRNKVRIQVSTSSDGPVLRVSTPTAIIVQVNERDRCFQGGHAELLLSPGENILRLTPS